MEPEMYQCPHCGAEIPNAEQKVRLHKTFCKSSYENFADGNLFKKSTMAGIFELLEVDLRDFPWGVIIRKNKSGQTTITYTSSKIHWSALAAGLASIYGGLFSEASFYLKIICLGVSVFSFIYFVFNLIYNRYAKWVLTIKDEQGTFYSGLGKFGRTITFEYNSDSTVAAVTKEDVGRSIVETIRSLSDCIATIPMFVISSLTTHFLETHFVDREGITVTTNGRQYNFGGDIPKSDVIKYMAAYLLQEMTK